MKDKWKFCFSQKQKRRNTQSPLKRDLASCSACKRLFWAMKSQTGFFVIVYYCKMNKDLNMAPNGEETVVCFNHPAVCPQPVGER